MRLKLDGTVKRLNLYATEELMERVDHWRARQPGVPNTSEAVRKLLEIALEAEGKRKRRINAA